MLSVCHSYYEAISFTMSEIKFTLWELKFKNNMEEYILDLYTATLNSLSGSRLMAGLYPRGCKPRGSRELDS